MPSRPPRQTPATADRRRYWAGPSSSTRSDDVSRARQPVFRRWRAWPRRQVQSDRIAAERFPHPIAGSSATSTRRIADARPTVASSTGGKVRPSFSRDPGSVASSSVKCSAAAPRDMAPPRYSSATPVASRSASMMSKIRLCPGAIVGHLGLECRSCCLERRHLRCVSLRKLRHVRRRWLFGEGRIRLVQCLDGGRDTGHCFIGVQDFHARPDHEVFELRPVTSHHPPKGSKRC